MKNQYLNPWFDRDKVHSQPVYQNNAPCVFQYRHVRVFKIYAKFYDYVLNDMCIGQYCAASRQAIDDILDGCRPVTDRVARHVCHNGGNAIGYSEYTAKYSNGIID